MFSMQASLFFILVVGLLLWFWLDGARAREFATDIARSMCRKRGFQFLDGTVEMQRKALRRSSNGICFRRMFRFDYSIEGTGRRSGHIILLGTAVEVFDLGLPKSPEKPVQTPLDDSAKTPEPVQPDTTGVVIPFKRPSSRK